MNYIEAIIKYQPYNEQEVKDKEFFLKYLSIFPDILYRENEIAHITASNWIVNQDKSKILMVYHKIYDSWSWTGGHADGEADLFEVALREAKEETGLESLKAITEEIYSLESLCVNGHQKNGEYVSSHLHLNVTFLLMADEHAPLKIKRDENSGVRWFSLKEALTAPSEVWMAENIYRKLIDKLKFFKR
jgi:8-oxo-dGTP pyrophosphatase MutT (NUDIX family)